MSVIPKPYEIYKHFKGNLYQIITVAKHTETGEELVIYQALYGDYGIYARELGMFTGLVDREKYPQATQKYRFELQKADELVPAEKGNLEKATEDLESLEGKIAPKEAKEPEAEEETEDSSGEELGEEDALDPMLLEFLEAETYEQRLNILAALHHRITDEMITTMAVVCDVEVKDGDLEERYDSLKSCLLTRNKYECSRLR